MGYRTDYAEILAHPWFKGVCLEDYLNFNLKPPIQPKLTEIEKLEFFDQNCISEDPRLSEAILIDEHLNEEKKSVFDEFQYSRKSENLRDTDIFSIEDFSFE